MPTPKQMLLEHLYDGPLRSDVTALLNAGASWREVAERVTTRTGVSISYESLRQWYGTPEQVAS